MNTYLKNITKYFRQSLIDADRLCPSDKELLPALGIDKSKKPDDAYIALNKHVWLSGSIDSQLANQIINSKQPKGKPPLQEVELVLFPRVDLFRYQGGRGSNSKRRVLLPLVVFVRLQVGGQLLPSNKAPWIPRIWMAPNQSSTQPFCEFSVVDDFLTLQPFEGIESWQQLVAYCTAFLSAATGVALTPVHIEENKSSVTLYDLELHPEYELSQQCLLQTETSVVGAKENILKVIDVLLDRQTKTPLYQTFCAETSPSLRSYQNLQHDKSIAKLHVGQMSGEFPLSPNQRNALHHFLKQEVSEILAINGPPGTGKTTLLRTVVANLWTQAAMQEKEPPLIVATSNNNQAVTNILESFAKVDEEGLEEALKGRWIQEVNSYGLYCCASSKANKENPYLYLGPRGDGCMSKWQTQEFLISANAFFIERVTSWHGEPIVDISRAKKLLHQSLCDTKKTLEQGLTYLDAFQCIEQALVDKHASVETLVTSIEATRQLYDKITKNYNSTKSQLDALYLLWEERSIWVRLLMWLPPISKHEFRKTARLLNQWDLELDGLLDDVVEAWFTQQMRGHKTKLNEAQKLIFDLNTQLEKFNVAKDALALWIKQNKTITLFSKNMADQVIEIHDRILRFKLFKLATHYWEARWLLELKEFFDDNDSDKKSPTKTLRKLRRFSKLTPCFVSTFYMVPSTFMAGEYQDNVWMDVPLFNDIDLLIVDEAGQALPEVSAVSFSLAKRALIVGDTDQIEPVWSVPASIDRANLKLFDLLGGVQKYDEFWLRSGLLASSGNIMRVAQRQSHYHQFSELQRGLYLTEHRRCYDNIVSYCNALVYKGILEPLRGESKTDVPWGTMSMISVFESSKSYGGSRGNPGEAKSIAQWLLAEREKVLHYARSSNPKWVEKEDDEVLKLAVGIITPFSKQAVLIRGELKSKGITGLTVGTVHSLQGDERLLVIFSSVYGESDLSVGKFYDMGSNMLNVAVSRAKDSFIVFGHPEVFGASSAALPSGVLRSRLVAIN